MKVIIQCAASKRRDAGKLRTQSGEEVLFVATPGLHPPDTPGECYFRPDDLCGEGTMTWRDLLKRFNDEGQNPWNLSRAADLYTPKEGQFRELYRELVDTFGWDDVFILSAGWGLVRAGFWTPSYDITFSAQSKTKKRWAWRNPKIPVSSWKDFNHLQNMQIAQDEPIHFFGGKDYLPTFYALIGSVPGRKIIHYKSSIECRPGFEYEEYKGPEKNRTWHYRAAKDFAVERESHEIN